MKLMRSTMHPPIGAIVFALNSKGFLGIALWDGEHWSCPDCSNTEREENKQSSWFTFDRSNPQRAKIMNDIAYWVNFEE